MLHGWGIEGEDYYINEDGLRDITAEVAEKKTSEDYDLKRGIRSLYGVINLPTYTSDGQPAFARFAPYYSTDSGADPRDVIIRQDETYNWHDDWMGTFYNDITEVDIVIQPETNAAIASARCAAVVKDLINNIIMAPTEEKAHQLYKEAVDKINAYGIEAWETEINRQIHSKRDKVGE